MEPKLAALKLFLDELGVPSDIDSVNDRKRVQKAVYLGQLSSVDLGYRFGWYIMGPYSPPLTRDYYQLADALQTLPHGLGDKCLKDEPRAKLAVLRPLLVKPPSVGLDSEQWLELVASYHFLRKVSGYSHDVALKRLDRAKPALAGYVSVAKEALEKHKLL